MLELICVLAGIALLFLLFAQARPDDGIRTAVLAAAAWFALYAVVSECLFVADRFTVGRAVVASDAVPSAVLAFCLFRRRRELQIKKIREKRIRVPFARYGIALIILLASMPFVWGKFGFYGMGQDEGVYQTQAINLNYGMTERQIELPEYGSLSPEEQAEYQETIQNTQIGFYTLSQYGDYKEYRTEGMSPVSGIFHGIPNYAAMLALSARIGGISHMMDIQTVFYVLSVLLFFMTAGNLRWRNGAKAVMTAVLAFSPLLIWITKSALTESFQLLLISAFLYFMTEERENSVWGACAAIVTYSFFHVITVIYIPFFTLYFLGMSWAKRSKTFAAAGIVNLIGFCAGMSSMAIVSPRYLYANFSYSIYKILPFMNDSNCMIILYAASVAGILLFLPVLLGKGGRAPSTSMESCQEGGRLVNVLPRLLILICLVLVCVLLVRQKAAAPDWLTAFQQLLIGAFVILTGIFALPLALGGILRRPAALMKKSGGILFWSLLYGVLIYSIVLKTESKEYYYYTRYITPYLGVVLLAAGVYLDQLLRRFRWFRGVAVAGFLVLAILYAPAMRTLYSQQDDTYMDWNTLEETLSVVHPGDAVILDDDLMRLLFFPLRSASGAQVYSRQENMQVQVRSLRENGSANVCFISDGLAENPVGDVIYKKSYETSWDNGRSHGTWIPLPEDFHKEAKQLVVYGCSRTSRLEYDVTDSSVIFRGLGDLEGDFRWSRSEDVSFQCTLEAGAYRMVLQCASGFPEKVMQDPEYCLQVYIDDVPAGVVKPESDGSFALDLPESLISGGEFVLRLHFPLWPAAYVSELDDRMLGMAVQKVTFYPVRQEE